MPSVIIHRIDNIYRLSSLFGSDNNDDMVTDLFQSNIFSQENSDRRTDGHNTLLKFNIGVRMCKTKKPVFGPIKVIE